MNQCQRFLSIKPWRHRGA